MKSVLFLGVLSLVFRLTAQEEVTISWSEDYKLEWSDFQGKVKAVSNEAASTASGLTFGYSISNTGNTIDKFDANVKAYFYPEKSWYIKEKANEHILGHEQLHFDITELFARKFRKALQSVPLKGNLKNNLQILHSRINKELYQLQRVYDQETNHSINKEVQKQWEEAIVEELKKLEAFKSY